VVEIPVSGKAFERPDIHWLIKFPATAPEFTGVIADTAADGRERVTLPDSINSFMVLPGSNMGNIFGDVNPYRAGVLAW